MIGKLGSIGDLVTPKAVLYQCGFLAGIPVRSLISRAFSFQRRLTDRQVQIERVIGEGDLITIQWRTTGRYEKPESQELHGTRVSVPSMSFLRFEDGRIGQIWKIQDTARNALSLHLLTSCIAGDSTIDPGVVEAPTAVDACQEGVRGGSE
jgi:hypothetical protein